MAQALVVLDDLEQLAAEAARWLEKAIDTRIRRTGSCSIALSGGSTPRPVYNRLALSPRIAWEKVHIYFGDERCVPPGDPSSNYRMAQEALLKSIRVPPAQVHRIRGEHPDPETAARDYDAMVPEQLDLILLGVGADGHTASIFPNSIPSFDPSRRAVHTTSPLPPRDRISITPRVIEAADALLVLASGADKAQAVAMARKTETDPVQVPARLALRGTWLIDRDASRLVSA
ncbi:MAG: 6-phosphogluconolactonase [Deltaproteobacteria bacterium]|nr:6-phosphogluconolactonase [Deltaproteobacteria bacterium]